MSTPSKKRRAAREWMQRVTERHENAMRSLRDMHQANVKAAREDERRKLTVLIPRNDDDVVYPLGKPEGAFFDIHAKYEPWHQGGFPPFGMKEDSYYEYMARCERHRLRITQHALRLPDGISVVWFGLELCR